jgi:hypothetical protein
MSQRVFRAGVAVVLVMATAACSDSQSEDVLVDPTGSTSSTTTPPSSANLVECPSSTTFETEESVLPLGGIVSLRGHSVSVPLGALLTTTTIGITEPASRYMMIDLSANGLDHFQFQAPLTVTLSYARCTRGNIDKGPLSVWLIDPATGELLAHMGGVDNKLTRTITFLTDHFSGYAIAN